MKRLYSYWTYPYLLSFLLFDILVTYFLFHDYDISFGLLFLVTLINAIFISGFILTASDLKRVYIIDDSIFYIYDLYSNIPSVVPLEQLRDFDRDRPFRASLLGIYKATFILENGQYVGVTFMKNNSIWNIRKYFYDED